MASLFIAPYKIGEMGIIESSYIQDGDLVSDEFGFRVAATAIIRVLVEDGVAILGSYEAMQDNPLGVRLIEHLETAQSKSVDATRQWLNGY